MMNNLKQPTQDGYRMPGEFESHKACWMVWPTPEIIKTLRFVKDLGKDNNIVDQAWTRAKFH